MKQLRKKRKFFTKFIFDGKYYQQQAIKRKNRILNILFYFE